MPAEAGFIRTVALQEEKPSRTLRGMSFPLAAVIAGLVAAIAWRLRALSPDGAGAAWAVGTAVLSGTGWPGGAVLIAFFLPSSIVSRVTEPRMPAWVDAKGTRRDALQVLANGGASLVGGLIGLASPEPGLWIVTGSLAAAAADTWATSVGALSRRDPRDVIRWTPVPKGTSGGVSLVGTVGGLLGGGIVAAVGALVTGDRVLGSIAVAIGASGMVADSILGATVQGRFRCPVCHQPSERRRHACGAATMSVGGVPWLTNDGVNALATALAAMAAFGIWRWL